MATKKQKHEAALARREAFIAEERELGRRAQECDRKRREAEKREAWEEGHKKHYKFIDECPHCADIKKRNKEAERKAAVDKIAAALSKPKVKKTIILDTPQDGILDPAFSHKDSA